MSGSRPSEFADTSAAPGCQNFVGPYLPALFLPEGKRFTPDEILPYQAYEASFQPIWCMWH